MMWYHASWRTDEVEKKIQRKTIMFCTPNAFTQKSKRVISHLSIDKKIKFSRIREIYLFHTRMDVQSNMRNHDAN